MASSSNTRAIDVINFLAAHPTEAFTLTELAEQLALSHGSAHRVLNALTEARYLSRHPKHKTYS
ncbi:helix-turn-helix domain-containing protein, partial [Litorivivens sp.]